MCVREYDRVHERMCMVCECVNVSSMSHLVHHPLACLFGWRFPCIASRYPLLRKGEKRELKGVRGREGG